MKNLFLLLLLFIGSVAYGQKFNQTFTQTNGQVVVISMDDLAFVYPAPGNAAHSVLTLGPTLRTVTVNQSVAVVADSSCGGIILFTESLRNGNTRTVGVAMQHVDNVTAYPGNKALIKLRNPGVSLVVNSTFAATSALLTACFSGNGGAADGNGIYGGSGTVPSGTVATVTNALTLAGGSSGTISPVRITGTGATPALQTWRNSADSLQLTRNAAGFALTSTGAIKLAGDSLNLMNVPSSTAKVPSFTGLSDAGGVLELKGSVEGQVPTWTNNGWVPTPQPASGGNGIYGGDGELPVDGTLVTLNDASLRFLTNTASGEDRDMIRLEAPYSSDDATTNYLVGVAGDGVLKDSFHLSNYDHTTILQTYGAALDLTSGAGMSLFADTRIRLTADSVIMNTVASGAAIPAVVGITAGGTIKKMVGTTNGQVLLWNAGKWQPGTATAGGVADGDYGDITVASNVWTIDPGAVTLAKMANLSASRIIGRGSAGGTGVPQSIVIGTGLQMSNDTLKVNASAGSGGIYAGSGTIFPAAVATLTANSSFKIRNSVTNGNLDALQINDANGMVRMWDKTHAAFSSVLNGTVKDSAVGGFSILSSTGWSHQLGTAKLFDVKYAVVNGGLNAIRVDDVNDATTVASADGLKTVAVSDAAGLVLTAPDGNLAIGATAATYTGQTGTAGIEYAADYSANYSARSLVDKTHVATAINTAVTGLAPNTPSYVTLATDAGLSNERVYTVGTNISYVDNGPGNTLVVSAGTTRFSLPADVAPATLAANQNNYTPTGLAGTSTLNLTASTPVQITGIAAGSAGDLLYIYNSGSSTITLVDESASSTAANRFAFSTNVSLTAGAGVTLKYSTSLSRWAGVGYQGVAATLANWAEAFNSGTQATSSFTATNAATNVFAALVPKGNGGVIAAIPDGAATGGGVRGQNAVDLQTSRATQAQIASGNFGTIGGGNDNSATGTEATVGGGSGNTASGAQSTVAGGSDNSATATGSFAVGDQNVASGIYASATGRLGAAAGVYSTTRGLEAVTAMHGSNAQSAGKFTGGVVGDAQQTTLIVRREITGTAQSELFLDGNSLAIQLPATTSNRAWNVKVDLVAGVSAPGNGTVALGQCYASWTGCLAKRTGATSSLIGSQVTFATAQAEAQMSTSATTLDVDNVTDTLRVHFTPPSTAGSTTRIKVVATVTLTEIGTN